jgi:sulfur relay (sulfurtransferase) complex TusBCD TusD component (DsrE family)
VRGLLNLSRPLVAAFLILVVAPLAAAGSFKLSLDSELGRRLSNLPENGWVRLNQNQFQDVWTPTDQRPKPPNVPSVGGPWAVLDAWSSMAWDSNRGNLIFWGGGHANYPGNEVYRWVADGLRWERASLPSEVVQPFSTWVGFFEAIDGPFNAPISAHTYDSSEFLPLSDRFVTFGGAAFNTGTVFMLGDGRRTGPYFWDPSRASANAVGGTAGSQVKSGVYPSVTAGAMWQNRNNLHPAFPGEAKPGYGGTFWIDGTTAYAEEGGKDVLYISVGSQLFRYTVHDRLDPLKDTYDLLGVYSLNPFAGQGAGAFDPVRRIYLRTANSTFTYWTLDNPGWSNQNVVISPTVTSGTFPISDLRNHGLDFDPVRRSFLLWGGQRDVWRLTAPANLASGAWQLTPLTPGSAGAPNLGGAVGTKTGILGKWKYIPALDVFLGVIDREKGEVWAYKPQNWQPQVMAALPFVVSPAAGSVHGVGTDVPITVDSVDKSVSYVAVYVNGSLVATGNSAPRVVPWTPTAVGDHVITARAVGADGIERLSAPVSVSVNNPSNLAPTVALTSPAAGQSFVQGTAVTLSATASDSDGTVSRVEFYANGVKLGEDTSAPYSYSWAGAPVGSHTLAAMAYDNAGASKTSASATISVSAPNVAPTVALTSPAAGQSFVQGTAVTLSATANDSDGTVSRVEFRANGMKLGEDTSAPYSYSWAGAPVGSHTLTAMAYDNAGASKISAAVTISVTASVPNAPPAVALTAPAAGQSFVQGTAVTLSATASDSDGTVSRVEFYANGVKLGEDTSAPYSYSWMGAPVGSHMLTSVVYDNAGASGTSAAVIVSVVVGGGGEEQTLVLRNGLNGYTGAADAYLYEYHSSLNFGAAQFLQDKASVSRFRSLVRFAIFQSEGGPVPNGATIVSAKLGLYKYSYYDTRYQLRPLVASWAEGEVTWNQRRLGVPWAGPGATAVGGDLAASADAAADVLWNPGWLEFDVTAGVRAIAQGRSNQGWLLEALWGNGNTKNFYSSEYTADTTRRPVLTVRYVTSGAVNAPPDVTLTSPAAGQSFVQGTAVTLSATASDSDGTVSRVEFYANGVKLGEDTSAPYSYSWAGAPVGSHTLAAMAYDNAGASKTSASATISVSAPNVAPTVALTSPAAGQSFVQGTAVTLSATANDSDGTVSRVEFRANGMKLGEDTSAPYSYSWAGAPVGSHTLTAMAYDNAGASKISAAVTISVTASVPNAPPAVALTAPAAGQSFVQGTAVTLSATASDSDGTVSRVEFYANGVKLGEDTSAPYSYSWMGAPVGSHMLTSVVYDNAGASGTSAAVIVSVVVGGGGEEQTLVLRNGLNGYTGAADAYLYEYHSSLNFGAAQFLQDKASVSRFRSLVRFAIFQSEGGPVPNGATIVSAKLGLYKYSYYDTRYQLRPLVASWAEGEVTWNQRRLGVPWAGPGATAVGGDLAASADAAADVLWNPGWLEFDVTAGVRAIAQGRSNQGWLLEALWGNGNTKNFYSSEYTADTTRRPVLTIRFR